MDEKEKSRILHKLDEMQGYIHELGDILPTSEDEYNEDMITRRACEKTVELAIECVIDVCSMIVAIQKLGVPTDEDSIFDILVKTKIMSASFGKKLDDLKGFRNIVVHKYGEIDNELAFEFLSNQLDDFDEFYDLIIKYLDKK